MKKYKIYYKNNLWDEELKEMFITAECENDAIYWFLDYYGCFFMRCEFIEWI